MRLLTNSDVLEISSVYTQVSTNLKGFMPKKPYVIKKKKSLRKLKVAKLVDTPEFWDELFNAVSLGMSMMEWCVHKDVPYTTIQGRIRKSAELAQSWSRAREARALVHAEQIEKLAQKCEDEEIKPDTARVAIQARQWLASRMDASLWGEKIQADIKVTDVSQVYLEQLKTLMLAREPKDITPSADNVRTNEGDDEE